MGGFQSKNSYQVEKEEKKKGVDQTKRTSYKQDSPNTQQMKNEAKQNILKAEQRCSKNISDDGSKIKSIPKSNNPDIIIPLRDYNETSVDTQNAEVKISDTVKGNNIKEQTKADNLISSNNQNSSHHVEKDTNNSDSQKVAEDEECEIQAVSIKSIIEESAPSHSKQDIAISNAAACEIITELSNQESSNTNTNTINHIKEKEDKTLDNSCVNKVKDSKLDLDKIEVCNDLCSAKAEPQKDDIHEDKNIKKQEHEENCKNKSEDSKQLPEQSDLDKIEVCESLSNVKLENEKDNEVNREIHTEKALDVSHQIEKQPEEKSTSNKNKVEVVKKDDNKKSETHVRSESKGDIKLGVDDYTLKENVSAIDNLEENEVKKNLKDTNLESKQQEKSKENVENTVKIERILNNQESTKAETTEAKRKQAVEEIQNIIIASVTQGIKMESLNNSGTDKDLTGVIKDIENKVKLIKSQVMEKLPVDDKDYAALENKLVGCMVKLEGISIEEDDKLENQKKDVMKQTQDVLDMLRDNIEQTNIRKDKVEIAPDNVKK